MNMKLRKPQLRILVYLANHRLVTRKQIAQHASVDYAYLTEYLGRTKPDSRGTTESRSGFPSLLTLGFVEMEQHEVNNRMTVLYSISKEGRKHLELLQVNLSKS